jgi:hypothetical protein
MRMLEPPCVQPVVTKRVRRRFAAPLGVERDRLLHDVRVRRGTGCPDESEGEGERDAHPYLQPVEVAVPAESTRLAVSTKWIFTRPG